MDLNGAEKEQAKGGKELEYRKKPLDYLETAVSRAGSVSNPRRKTSCQQDYRQWERLSGEVRQFNM